MVGLLRSITSVWESISLANSLMLGLSFSLIGTDFGWEDEVKIWIKVFAWDP